MRLQMGLGAALGVGLLVTFFAAWDSSTPPSDLPERTPSRGLASFARPLTAPPAGGAPSRATSSIRGTVRGARGLVAGATVFASRSEPGESLSSLPCVASIASLYERESECFDAPRIEALVGQHQGEAPVVAQALTAEDGSFWLDGLEAGAYALWVESTEGVGLRRDVAVGEEDVELVLTAGSRLSGDITDEQRAPVAGARVTAVFLAHSRFFDTVTDERGHYRLGPLPRGEYMLVASHPDLRPRSQSLRLHPPDVRQSLVLTAPRTVLGRVVDGDGQPVADAEVWLREQAERRGRTDAQGRFSFEDLKPDEHWVVARHGNRVGIEQASFLPSEEDARSPRTRDITVPLDGNWTGLDGVVRDERGAPAAKALVTLYVGRGCGSARFSTRTDTHGAYHFGPLHPARASLSASAEDDRSFASHRTELTAGPNTVDLALEFVPRVEGLLVDERGEPVAGEEVWLRAPPGQPEWVAAATSDAQGSFSVHAAHPGPLRLTVGGDSDEEAPSRTWSQDVSVPSADLRVVLTGRLTVEGEVVDEEGQPVPRARMSLWSDTPTVRLIAQGTTDARGRFSFAVPRPGRYQVSAELQDAFFALAATRAVEVGPGGARVRLAFEAGHALSGVVVDTQGKPLKDVLVHFHSELRSPAHTWGEPRVETRTGPDGRFTFASVSGNAVALSVHLEGHLLSEVPLREDDRQLMRLDPSAREVRIVLARRATLSARLVHPEGSPVTAFMVNGEPQWDDEGRLEWPIARDGSITLRVSAGTGDEDARPVALTRTVFVRQEVDQDLGVLTLP